MDTGKIITQAIEAALKDTKTQIIGGKVERKQIAAYLSERIVDELLKVSR